MSATVESIEKNVATIKIEVNVEEYAKAVKKSFDKNKKRFTVPGFRKGKVPKQVIESHYGKGVFTEDAIEFAFGPAYSEALKETDVKPVTRPQLEKIEKASEEEGATIVVKVGLKPEVELGVYKGAEIETLEVEISEEALLEELKKTQDQNARLITLESGEVKDGDTAIIDYEGFLNDVPFEGGKGEEYELLIGSGTFIPGFEEQLVGATVGGETTVDVTFPEDYLAENLKGQGVVFKVKINAVKRKELPELDDEFAKDTSEFDTLDELKESIKTRLQDERKAEGKRMAEMKSVDYAVDNAKIEIPHLLVEEEAENNMNNFATQVEQQGISLDDYFKYTNTNQVEFRKTLTEEAEKNIRIELVLTKIGEVEGVEASEEEIEKEIKILADAYGQDFEEYKKNLQERMLDYIKANVTRRKTVELLVEAATVKTPESSN